MRRIFFMSLILITFAVLFMLTMGLVDPAFALNLSPTPTYDPLVEPLLPANPTEFELGRNLYWHWCMTCHGDRGQGLTDAWRAVWVKDHQNCWARGCHAGHNGDQGFPIPTVVPLIIGDGHLAQFTALHELSTYLKNTHPPQSPGILKAEEYHAIAVYVFTLNDRSLATAIPTSSFTPTPPPSATPARDGTQPASAPGQWFVIILVGLALVVFLGLFRAGRRFKK